MLRLFTTFSFLLLSICLVSAQEKYELITSHISIAGTSNVHDWESDATKITAWGDILLENNTLKSIKNLTVNIPVGGIKSSKGSIMDKKTWGSLKKDEFPTIKYTLTKVNSLTKNGDSYEIKTTGNLSIAGETKSIDMTVKGKVFGNDLQFDGSKKLKMTDFKIDPPTALMGTMKTGDEVTINFSVKLSKNTNVN